MKNTIILTHGWSGSSVFSGLLARQQMWLGDQTIRKPDYDTFENAELVRLNRSLLQQLAPGLDHEHAFDRSAVDDIAQRANTIDLQPLRDFLAQCNQHAPWLWKDPRLTWTIRIWARVLDLENTSFLVLTRDPMQAWVTSNLRRHVQSLRFTRDYNNGITACNTDFLTQHRLPWLQTSFEELLLDPDTLLPRMNAFFGTALTVDTLRSVCRMPLYQRSRGWKDVLMASAVYLRNYRERDGRRRSALMPTV